MSMVKMLELELNTEVSKDMSEANITASIRPLTPSGIFSFTNIIKARLEPSLKEY
jgi:hypothetical protein